MWTTLTSALLEARMPVEWPKVQQQIARQATFATVVDGIIADVVAQVRGSIAQGTALGKQPALGAEGSVPPELVRVALILCRIDLAAVLPNAIVLNDTTRQSLAKDARDTLAMVAKGEFKVSPASVAATNPPPTAPPLYGGDQVISWPGTTEQTNAS